MYCGGQEAREEGGYGVSTHAGAVGYRGSCTRGHVVLKYSLLGSGSSGNSTLLTHDGGAILVDMGFSYKEFSRRVHKVLDPDRRIDAIFLTHEHSDHCAGLGVLCRRMDIPVYMTQGTQWSLPERVGEIPTIRMFESGETVEAGGFTVESFHTSHDAADPVCFTICHNGSKVGIVTDMGMAPELVKQKLSGCNVLLLECNYDPTMLTEGEYPDSLKKRIRSNTGHLSNYQSASLLKSVMHDDLRTVVAMHISDKNNTPELVREAIGGVFDGYRPVLKIASQDEPTELREV